MIPDMVACDQFQRDETIEKQGKIDSKLRNKRTKKSDDRPECILIPILIHRADQWLINKI